MYEFIGHGLGRKKTEQVSRLRFRLSEFFSNFLRQHSYITLVGRDTACTFYRFRMGMDRSGLL